MANKPFDVSYEEWYRMTPSQQEAAVQRSSQTSGFIRSPNISVGSPASASPTTDQKLFADYNQNQKMANTMGWVNTGLSAVNTGFNMYAMNQQMKLAKSQMKDARKQFEFNANNSVASYNDDLAKKKFMSGSYTTMEDARKKVEEEGRNLSQYKS